MEMRRVGSTGLRVSSLGLGTMTWGRDTDEHEAEDQIKAFADAGGTLVDTAASYSEGAAEELLGSLLGPVMSRSDVTICTKAGVRYRGGAAAVDASRGVLLDSLDDSLHRLNTDHVDLWLVQSPDRDTPLAETVSALEIAVTSGRARYVGLSNHPGWQLARVATILEATHVGLAVTESEYSLLNRTIEHELIPAAQGLGVGVFAWSPAGRGVLTAKYRHGIPADSRAASPHLAGFVEPYLNETSNTIVAALATAAEGLGRTPLEVALAWAVDRPSVSSAIVGARTAAQLQGSLGSVDLELPREIADVLNEITTPSTQLATIADGVVAD